MEWGGYPPPLSIGVILETIFGETPKMVKNDPIYKSLTNYLDKNDPPSE